ncbi:MAG: hypothetical protein IJ558_13145 [Treponema sp.]|nr:hypothetical protein [Treponema sp.]
MELTDSIENDIQFALAAALEATITANVETEIASKPNAPLPFPKEVLVNKILQKNIDQLEESLYMTRGKDGKIYLAGVWLMRPLLHDGNLIPTMEYLKKVLNSENIVFIPNKTGAEVRKEIW